MTVEVGHRWWAQNDCRSWDTGGGQRMIIVIAIYQW